MYQINDELTTKKPHACGGNEWIVIRNGADYKLMCKKCGRIIMVDSAKIDKMMKKATKAYETEN